MKKLRIAQISTIWEKTPPPLYGGTERVVSFLTEELVKRGHDVTLFATGDSKTSAKLESVYPRALYRDGIPWTNGLYPLLHITNALDKQDNFDIIHMHFNTRQDYIALALAEYIKKPMIFTIHFVLPGKNEKDKKDRLRLLNKYRNRNFVSISNAQKTLKFLNFIGTAYNGVDFSEFKFFNKHQGYLAWLGRICHDKGTWEAIQTAKKTGHKIILGGKVDEFNQEYKKYYEEKIKPEIDGKNVIYIGELNTKQKVKLMGNAKAVLMPINWNEPFGLVTVESMACGTPVIAFNKGPVKEQIINNKTGYIVKDLAGMINSVSKLDNINRKKCREHALQKFSVSAMTDSYESIYKKILK
ncbi:MAG: glycosyltransferase family 4 protein [Candidatus Woesearchaeota archaeon]